MIGVMAAGQLGQTARAQSAPTDTQSTPALFQPAPWTLHTSLAVTEQYTDNVFLSTGPNDPNTPERSDTVTVLKPALTLSRKAELFTIKAHYQPSFNFYAKYHDDLNYIGQDGNIAIDVDRLGPGLFQHTGLNLLDKVTYTEAGLYSSPGSGQTTGNGGIITQRTKTWNNISAASLIQHLTPALQGIASYDYVNTRYKNPGLTDSSQQGMTFNLSDHWTEQITTSAIYSYTILKFQSVSSRNVTQSLTVRLDYAATPVFHTRLTLGSVYLSSTNKFYPTAIATVIRSFQYTSVALSYSNLITTGGGITQVPTINQTGSLTITRSMGPHAHAAVSGSYTNQQTTTTPTGITQSFGIGAHADYALTKWLKAAASYNHSAQHGNNSSAGQDIRWNTVAFTLDGNWDTQIQ